MLAAFSRKLEPHCTAVSLSHSIIYAAMRPPTEAASRISNLRNRIAGLCGSGRHEMPLDRQGFPFLLSGNVASDAGSIFASKGSQAKFPCVRNTVGGQSRSLIFLNYIGQYKYLAQKKATERRKLRRPGRLLRRIRRSYTRRPQNAPTAAPFGKVLPMGCHPSKRAMMQGTQPRLLQTGVRLPKTNRLHW